MQTISEVISNRVAEMIPAKDVKALNPKKEPDAKGSTFMWKFRHRQRRTVMTGYSKMIGFAEKKPNETVYDLLLNKILMLYRNDYLFAKADRVDFFLMQSDKKTDPALILSLEQTGFWYCDPQMYGDKKFEKITEFLKELYLVGDVIEKPTFDSFISSTNPYMLEKVSTFRTDSRKLNNVLIEKLSRFTVDEIIGTPSIAADLKEIGQYYALLNYLILVRKAEPGMINYFSAGVEEIRPEFKISPLRTTKY